MRGYQAVVMLRWSRGTFKQLTFACSVFWGFLLSTEILDVWEERNQFSGAKSTGTLHFKPLLSAMYKYSLLHSSPHGVWSVCLLPTISKQGVFGLPSNLQCLGTSGLKPLAARIHKVFLCTRVTFRWSKVSRMHRLQQISRTPHQHRKPWSPIFGLHCSVSQQNCGTNANVELKIEIISLFFRSIELKKFLSFAKQTAFKIILWSRHHNYLGSLPSGTASNTAPPPKAKMKITCISRFMWSLLQYLQILVVDMSPSASSRASRQSVCLRQQIMNVM